VIATGTAEDRLPERVRELLDRGVVLPAPETVDIGAEVDAERIAPGVVIHAGCRIRGMETSVGPGSVIGREQPATLISSQLGHEVTVAGGSVEGATLLDRASLGSGAHVRSGTLLEEQASAAHTVGLKQTVLFPFVTLGSLINFCDCLMAGGTGPQNHSEVGSSYVHFNFTPQGDKATASLLGDVPRGVMLDRPPIFLGGQGGLVGPVRIQYGTVLAAGSICRRDVLVEGHLVVPDPPPPGASSYPLGCYHDIGRVVTNGLLYLGNIRALQHWYREVRRLFLQDDPYRMACHRGALSRLDVVFQERVHRLEQLANALPRSMALLRQNGISEDSRIFQRQHRFHAEWPTLKAAIQKDIARDTQAEARDRFLQGLARIPGGTPWVEAIQSIDPQSRRAGTEWLQGIVDRIAVLWHGTAA
jgi:UDP-N-acetylglucosamine/UDP-N-acetylgalactosamine diphosphorylase